jgi:BCD family chlorophyll transporter-like MFS transporter
MMGMSTSSHTGLYMGAWTLAQALGNGVASVGGGWLFDLAKAQSGSEAIGYSAVFVVEAIGLLAALALLSRVRPSEFRREAAQSVGA